MSFDIDCAEGACRTEILAGSATDAPLFVHDRNLWRTGVAGIRRHHLNGTGRTVPGTVSAFYSVGERHAVFLYPYGVAYLRGRLVRKCDRAYCSSRTDIAASRTFRAAVTAFVAHFRLHQPHQVGSGTKHLVRTCRHAQLAGGAVPGKMLRAPCARRHDRRIAVRNLFVFDDCQSAVYLLFLCLQGNGCCHQSGCGKEAAPGRPFAFVCGGVSGSVFLMLFLRKEAGEKLMAPLWHLPMQSMQATQRL